MSNQVRDETSSLQGEDAGASERPNAGREGMISENPLPHELIQQIPEEARTEIIQSILLYREQYSGPIAHPRIAEGWERILPGSADRILTLTEQQQQHRFELEKNGQKAAVLRERIGISSGFVLGIGLLALSAFAIASGVALASVAFVGTCLASVAGVYVHGFRVSKKELQAKRNALSQPSTVPKLPAGQQEDHTDPSQ